MWDVYENAIYTLMIVYTFQNLQIIDLKDIMGKSHDPWLHMDRSIMREEKHSVKIFFFFFFFLEILLWVATYVIDNLGLNVNYKKS